jgi:hypothetical protein
MPKEKIRERKDNKIMLVIVFSIVFFIAGGVAGYFIGHHAFPRNNFSNLSDSAKAEITTFFENSPSSDQITAYCQQNPSYCIYYCRQNPNFEYCSQLNLSPQGGMPSQTG